MVAVLVVLGLLVIMLIARRRDRSKRKFSSNVFADVLKLRKPYKGSNWRVGDRWL
ncbi:MAG: hypothetical protein LC722_04790 [Actinobacteria bacterium]|nr:hypothetical protein [Actinomycetota bacterium]